MCEVLITEVMNTMLIDFSKNMSPAIHCQPFLQHDLMFTMEQITAVMRKLMGNKKIANATHNMLAYRIMTGGGVVYQGCDDDGETHAGSRMLHLLQVLYWAQKQNTDVQTPL